jgi:hypothetical protein
MRLQNAVASLDAPLDYPTNVAIPAQAPQSKQELMFLTGVCHPFQYVLYILIWYAIQGANCKIVAQALDLPALPNNATTTQRRQQIIWAVVLLNDWIPTLIFSLILFLTSIIMD